MDAIQAIGTKATCEFCGGGLTAHYTPSLLWKCSAPKSWGCHIYGYSPEYAATQRPLRDFIPGYSPELGDGVLATEAARYETHKPARSVSRGGGGILK